MRLHEILATEELAIHEPALAIIVTRMSPFFARLARQEDARLEGAIAREDGLTLADFINGRRDYAVDENGLATIHVNDVLGRGLARIDQIFGMTDYNALIAELGQASDDAAVRGILLDVSSPGGSVVGMEEAAAALESASQAKPVVAMIEQIGASAAYRLAVGAHAIVASPSAVVGSIGTISTFANLSGLFARMGVKVEHLTGGELKAAGTPYRDMTRAERDFLQGRVDQFTAEFHAAVQAARPQVADSSMRGQWFTGRAAMQLGLVDQLGSKADALQALSALVALTQTNVQ